MTIETKELVISEELKEKNRSLKHSFEHLKDKFVNLIKLIKNRIFYKKNTKKIYGLFKGFIYSWSYRR